MPSTRAASVSVAPDQHASVLDASSTAARRAKKREQDRRCQRMARERTKNRIAQLEGIVADLKQQGTSKQEQALWKQRDELAAERDALAQTLRTIERVI